MGEILKGYKTHLEVKIGEYIVCDKPIHDGKTKRFQPQYMLHSASKVRDKKAYNSVCHDYSGIEFSLLS